jgi:hypothetical protein
MKLPFQLSATTSYVEVNAMRDALGCSFDSVQVS